MSQDRMLFIIVTLLSIIALISFFISPFFELRNINVKGLNILTRKEIKDNISNYMNKNIWLINKSEIKSLIYNNSYIKKVEVSKNFPDTLTILIEERIPLGKINNNGNYLVFDKNGYILEKGSLKSRFQVPEIKGIGYSFAEHGLTFPPTFAKIVQALEIVNQQTREEIGLIKLNNKKELILEIDSDIYVYLGHVKQLKEKFKVLESVLHKVVKEKLKVDYIDLRIINKPVIKLLQ